MSKSVLIWVGAMLTPLLFVGCNTEQMIEDAGQSGEAGNVGFDSHATSRLAGCLRRIALAENGLVGFREGLFRLFGV